MQDEIKTQSQASVFYSMTQQLPNKRQQFYQTSEVESLDEEKTLVRFDDELLLKEIQKDNFQQELQKYSLDDRKYLIIDRNNSVIIDMRQQQAMEDFQKKVSATTKGSMSYNHNLSLDQAALQGNRKKWQSNSVNKTSVWEDHWKQTQKTHEQFISAICHNNFQQFNRLLNTKTNPIPIQINYKSESNWSPIHYAAMHSSAPILAKLINHPQIDVNELTDFGWTALHIAVQANKVDNCELLVGAGVCIDYRDKEGDTALHYAAEFGYKRIVELLIKNGASQWMRNVKGLTARDLCKSEDLRLLFEKPEDNQEEEVDSFYRLRRHAFVERMLTTSVNHTIVSSSSNNSSLKQQGNSPFLKNKLVEKSKNLQQKPEKGQQSQQRNFKPHQNLSPKTPSPPKAKTAQEHRRQNIFKLYSLMLNKKTQPVTLSSFKFYKKIGQGAFGQVYVVKKSTKSDKFYALKAIKKQKVIGTALYRYIQTQKDVLSLISHPFIVKLHYAFQTQAYLFLVMDYCEGGDMSRLLEKKQRLEEKVVRMYAAEILLGIQALHKNMIIYRDMKPQNIVLDRQGHACITDFGLSKKTNDLNAINKSFCGTPAYLPLEIINKKGHTRMADWYEFGIVLYELLTGIPPFYAETKTQLYEKVRQGVIRFPKNSSEVFRDLIKKLLAQNPQKRLGFENDAQSVKQHEWFKDVDWDEVYQRRQKMPPVETKIKVPNEPIKTKFADIKSQKYFIPSWSFIS